MRFLFILFFIAHGIVHGLYFGQAARYYELQPGMTWPDGSWALTPLFGDGIARIIVGFSCVLAAIGFIAGGLGLLIRQPWWQPVVVGSAAFSAVVFMLSWNGDVQTLTDEGSIGLMIDVAILISLVIFQWPYFDFQA